MDKPSTADLTKPDGNLELNIGKINIVFLYRFITELLVSVCYFEEHVSVVEMFNDREYFWSTMSLKLKMFYLYFLGLLSYAFLTSSLW